MNLHLSFCPLFKKSSSLAQHDARIPFPPPPPLLQSVYVSHSLYIAEQPAGAVSLFGLTITLPVAIAIFVVGFIFVGINYDADRQRALARSTDGDCSIFGSKAEVLRVKYVTETGVTKDTILLTSGWWSLGRHFHYVPEILASLAWCVMPAEEAGAH